MNPNCETSINGFSRIVEKKMFIASKIVYNKRKNMPARNSFLFHRIASTTAATATIILRYSNLQHLRRLVASSSLCRVLRWRFYLIIKKYPHVSVPVHYCPSVKCYITRCFPQDRIWVYARIHSHASASRSFLKNRSSVPVRVAKALNTTDIHSSQFSSMTTAIFTRAHEEMRLLVEYKMHYRRQI